MNIPSLFTERFLCNWVAVCVLTELSCNEVRVREQNRSEQIYTNEYCFALMEIVEILWPDFLGIANEKKASNP